MNTKKRPLETTLQDLNEKKSDKKHCQSLEYKSLEEGGPRVKFDTKWNGTVGEFLKEHESTTAGTFQEIAQDMSDIMWELEQDGATPVLPDGKVGGNAAAILKIAGKDCMVVSRSGKESGQKMDLSQDVCIVSTFDPEKWYGEYLSKEESIRVTSDTPMHHSVLIDNQNYGWSDYPAATLHGHALETEEDAEKYGFPISKEETLFSTPEDTAALKVLLCAHPYPENKVYTRKGHGFFILGKDLKDALEVFRTKIKPAISQNQV